MIKIKTLVAFVGLTLTTVSAAGVVVAKKDGVSIYKDASKKATILATLKKGDERETIERKGMYWKVKNEAGEGFVSVLQVKRQPSGSSSLSKAIRAAAQKARTTDDTQDSRARSAVMGVRGLSDSDTVSAAGNVSPNTRVVYEMEDRQVSAKKIEELGNAIYAEVERRVSKR